MEEKIIGLTSKEVEERKEQGLVNKTNLTVGKSYLRIIYDNLFSFFNIVLYIIAGLMIYGGYFTGLFFLAVLIPNIIIGLYEDITARKLMDKLHVINAPKANVLRDNVEQKILGEEIVLDDVVFLGANDQVCADCYVLEGTIGVNESMLTGEPDTIYKNKGDVIYSGSYVVNGKGYVKVDKIGNDSYIQKLQSVAKKFKRSKSEILSSLNNMFKVIGGTVIIMAIAMLVVYSIQGKLAHPDEIKKAIGPFSGSLVAMIPAGLYLLTSVALATAVINLARKNAQVQDFYSVEMLARTDVICVDKTGTITDGTMLVKNIIPLVDEKETYIKSILFKVLNATGDTNATAKALLKVSYSTINDKPLAVLPFDSENKYSGASFSEGTYLIGAPEFVNLNNKQTIIRKAEEYTSKGLRVLVLAKGKDKISGKSYEKPCETLAILVIQDHIKEDAKETFEWFKENGVTIKVISGDNAITVSEIAKTVGIEYADRYISLEGKSEEEVRDAANKYVVFGRVTPEQKSVLVEALQAEKHTVAMTGDGVNDILALKKADCSIAMASGAEASKNVSHIVLMNSNFSSLPAVVAEGRRVVNNLQRTCSLFLCKTIFAVAMTLTFLLASLITRDSTVVYPFVTNHLYIWETICLGLPAFFLALQPNNERINGHFLMNISKKAIPGGIAMVAGVFVCFSFLIISKAANIYTGVGDFPSAVNMAVLFISTFCVVILYNVCAPLDKYRAFVLVIASLVALGCLGFSYLAYINGLGNIFRIEFQHIGSVNLFIACMVLLAITTLYLAYFAILKVLKSGDEDNDKEGVTVTKE